MHLKKNAPNTAPLYRKNIERNQGLLQALEMFGKKLRTAAGLNCAEGMGRVVHYSIKRKRISLRTVSACRPGPNEISKDGKSFKKVTTFPKHIANLVRHFSADLIDDKRAACNYSRYNKNAARLIKGTFTAPNIYNIEAVGKCVTSPICYVDVDFIGAERLGHGCISKDTRRRL